MIIDTTSWGWPQWVWLALMLANIAMGAALHGKPRTGNYSIGTAIVGAFIGLFIVISGGFFS